MNAKNIAGKGNAGLARAEDRTLLARKSVLMGMLTSGFVFANAAQPSAVAATQPPYVLRWTPFTAYASGQQVISPNNDVVAATVGHTSKAAYVTDTAKWTLSGTYLTPAIAAQNFKSTFLVTKYGAVGDGTHDDTSAFQAAFTAAIAANGTVVIPEPSVEWVLSATVQIVPAGALVQAFVDIEAVGNTNAIRWAGGSNTTVFHSLGWKISEVQGLKIRIPDTANNVVVWDLDTSATIQSSTYVRFKNVFVHLGSGVGNIAYRLGYVAGGIGDISMITWDGASVYGNDIATVTGQIGWLIAGGNVMNLTWINGFGAFLDKMVTNKAISGKIGAANWTFIGFGGSHNAIDFENSSVGSICWFGGRFEVGKRFLNVPVGRAHSTYQLSSVEINDYEPTDEIVFSVLRPSSILVDTCRISRATTDHTAAMFTLADTPYAASLLVRGGALRAVNQFWTEPNADSWQVSVQSVAKMADLADAPTLMPRRDGLQTVVKDMTGFASVTPDAARASIFQYQATDTIPAVTINKPVGGARGQRITFDLANNRASAAATYTFATGAGGFIMAGAFFSPTAGGYRRMIEFYFDGGAWIESFRSAANIG